MKFITHTQTPQYLFWRLEVYLFFNLLAKPKTYLVDAGNLCLVLSTKKENESFCLATCGENTEKYVGYHEMLHIQTMHTFNKKLTGSSVENQIYFLISLLICFPSFPDFSFLFVLFILTFKTCIFANV